MREVHERIPAQAGFGLMDRPELSVSDVWTLLKAGCNVLEVATYAQVTLPIARAMCAEAIREAHG